MVERDISAEEISEAVRHPQKLSRGRLPGRYKAEKRFNNRQVTVIYDKLARDTIKIITVY